MIRIHIAANTPREHAFDHETGFCTVCAADRYHPHPRWCADGDNVTSIVHIICKRRAARAITEMGLVR